MTTVVLGLDGAGFELLDPWIRTGELPAFEHLRKEGVATNMTSCRPPVTCPNWKCYATGKNPGKLGVFWWEHVDRENNEIVPASNSNQFDGTNYWEFMNGEVACLNLPTSFPPHEINGVHVAGGPGADQDGYAEPASFGRRLEENYDYRVHPRQLSKLAKDDPDNECVKEIRDLINTRFEVIEDMVHENNYEFIHLSIFYINMLQHFYYDHPSVKKTWKLIDHHVSNLLDQDNLDRLFIMSDHGSNRVEHWFRINTWLEQNNYLSTTSSSSTILHRIGITKQRVRRLLNLFGIEWWARKLVPDQIQDMVPTNDGVIKKTAKSNVIDWQKSTAVASGQGPIYILEDDPGKRAIIRDKLIDQLSGLRTPSGEIIISDANPSQELYTGPYVQEGPDILLDQAPNVHIDGGIGSQSVFDTPQTWNGENTLSGLFMAYGDDINATVNINDVHILDVAPTVLHALGYSIPSVMDGRVITEIFWPDSDPATRSVTRDSSTFDEQNHCENNQSHGRVTDRLSDLGYLE
jgi:predicted AlkP superfamily phosphohydrolase/phosphomutase